MSADTLLRVTVLADTSLRQCVLCLRVGQRGFNAAYSVLDISVCRRHLAKILDAAAKRPFPGTGAGGQTDRQLPPEVASLSQVRRNRGTTLRRDFTRELEKIGLFEIPAPPET